MYWCVPALVRCDVVHCIALRWPVPCLCASVQPFSCPFVDPLHRSWPSSCCMRQHGLLWQATEYVHRWDHQIDQSIDGPIFVRAKNKLNWLLWSATSRLRCINDKRSGCEGHSNIFFQMGWDAHMRVCLFVCLFVGWFVGWLASWLAVFSPGLAADFALE